MGASGGDMAMTADVSRELGFDFSPVPAASRDALKNLLASASRWPIPWIFIPICGSTAGVAASFGEVLNAGYDAVSFMLDCPPQGEADTASFDAVIDAYIESAQGSGTRAALIASLPETMGEQVRQRCLAGGVAPLQGQREGLEAMAWRLRWPGLAHGPADRAADSLRITCRRGPHADRARRQAGAGRLWCRYSPRDLAPANKATELAASLGYPVVMKASGAHLAHKSEAGGVVLNIRTAADAGAAAERSLNCPPRCWWRRC